MSIMVAVPDSVEGRAALDAAIAEARRLDTELVVVNLALTDLAAPEFPPGLEVTVLDREGRPDRDPADAVLDEIETRSVERLVIGIRRRSPVGKALLGSISQRLLLDSPVPVLAIKPSEAE
ncbi:universal stress protein [Saccharopolyspora erythraea]|uniref:universal stress protein n=1 Tax=Saccharopolyspora erythraea TaxID=1836 RepID=UPI001BA64BD1|nr:universal stress protein [Saccharopolyspora erythraea]QUH03557.1 universal stress protein [Saccharopolyspora erythraea]